MASSAAVAQLSDDVAAEPVAAEEIPPSEDCCACSCFSWQIIFKRHRAQKNSKPPKSAAINDNHASTEFTPLNENSPQPAPVRPNPSGRASLMAAAEIVKKLNAATELDAVPPMKVNPSGGLSNNTGDGRSRSMISPSRPHRPPRTGRWSQQMSQFSKEILLQLEESDKINTRKTRRKSTEGNEEENHSNITREEEIPIEEEEENPSDKERNPLTTPAMVEGENHEIPSSSSSDSLPALLSHTQSLLATYEDGMDSIIHYTKCIAMELAMVPENISIENQFLSAIQYIEKIREISIETQEELKQIESTREEEIQRRKRRENDNPSVVMGGKGMRKEKPLLAIETRERGESQQQQQRGKFNENDYSPE